MGNPAIGHKPCPLCGEDAEIREAVNRRAYLVCDGCVSQVKTMSKAGDRALRAGMRPAGAPPPPPPPPPPENTPAALNKPAPARKKAGGFLVDLMGGD